MTKRRHELTLQFTDEQTWAAAQAALEQGEEVVLRMEDGTLKVWLPSHGPAFTRRAGALPGQLGFPGIEEDQ